MRADEVTAKMLLGAYARGIFPMAEGRDDPDVFWVDPRYRGILPLGGFHISRSLARRLRRADFRITVDTDFKAVLEGCADRDETWISRNIERLYLQLHRMGRAHSLEVRDEDGRLVGGVYGVTLGAAYFGESMFSRTSDASKIALAYLVDRLQQGGFSLFDTQFLTPHLASLGGIEVPRATYHRMLHRALRHSADFAEAGPIPSPDQLLQRRTQTS